MASEIRVNKITHTAGVGTITTSADGIVVSGIVTANSFSGINSVTATSFHDVNLSMVQILQEFLHAMCMVSLELEVIYR